MRWSNVSLTCTNDLYEVESVECEPSVRCFSERSCGISLPKCCHTQKPLTEDAGTHPADISGRDALARSSLLAKKCQHLVVLNWWFAARTEINECCRLPRSFGMWMRKLWLCRKGSFDCSQSQVCASVRVASAELFEFSQKMDSAGWTTKELSKWHGDRVVKIFGGPFSAVNVWERSETARCSGTTGCSDGLPKLVPSRKSACRKQRCRNG